MLGVSDNTVRQKRARLRRKGNPTPSPHSHQLKGFGEGKLLIINSE
jgi:hypothetical protein